MITPDWMSGSLQLNEALAITYNRLYIVAFTLMVFAILQLVLKKTRGSASTSAPSRRTARWRRRWGSAATGWTR